MALETRGGQKCDVRHDECRYDDAAHHELPKEGVEGPRDIEVRRAPSQRLQGDGNHLDEHGEWRAHASAVFMPDDTPRAGMTNGIVARNKAMESPNLKGFNAG